MSGIFFTNTKNALPSRNRLRSELEEYRRRGAKLMLEGRNTSPRVIADAVAEHDCYMREYRFSDGGMVKSLDFRAIDHIQAGQEDKQIR